MAYSAYRIRPSVLQISITLLTPPTTTTPFKVSQQAYWHITNHWATSLFDLTFAEQFAERKFGLSKLTCLSQKVKWFRWAKVLRAKIWSKYGTYLDRSEVTWLKSSRLDWSQVKKWSRPLYLYDSQLREWKTRKDFLHCTITTSNKYAMSHSSH